MAYYHGSADTIRLGTLLEARPDGYADRADDELEALFESLRPDGCVPRASAVFMVEDELEIDAAGGYDDHVYEVEPVGATSRHDLAWYTEADCALGDGNRARAEECAAAYWSGVAHDVEGYSLFETLALSAEVVAPRTMPPML